MGDAAYEIISKYNSFQLKSEEGRQWYLMKYSITNKTSYSKKADALLGDYCKYSGSKITVCDSAILNDDIASDEVLIEPGETKEVWEGILIPECQQVPFIIKDGMYLNLNPVYASGTNDSIHKVVVDPAVAATKTKDGLTKGEHCSECKKVITPQTKILAKNKQPQQVVIKSASNVKGKKIKLSIKKQSVYSGYEVVYGLKKNFKGAKMIHTSKATVTIKGLKKKKKYYVRVRGYRIVDGSMSYGEWSKVKAIKIKK